MRKSRAGKFGRTFAAAIAMSMLTVTGVSSAAVPGGNLIQNPGAELGPNPPWVAYGDFKVEPYGGDNLPSTDISDSIGGGSYFFAGGSGDQVTYITQSVDVSGAAPEIDAGRVSAALSAHLGGWLDEGDYADVTAETQGADPSGAYTPLLKIGPVTPADRGNQTALLARSAAGPVPGGTRRIRITLTSTRVDGSYSDGYADNLALMLTETPAAAPDPDTGAGTAPAAYTPRRSRFKGVKVRGRRVKGRVAAPTQCRAGRRVVIKKGRKTIGSGRSKGGGSFNIKTKKHKKGKLTVTVRKRTVGTTDCLATTKRIPGRN